MCGEELKKRPQHTSRARRRKTVPHLVEGEVLIVIQGRTLSAGEQRSQEISPFAFLIGKGTTPSVAAEGDGHDTVLRGQVAVLTLGVDHHSSTSSTQCPVQLHLDDRALAHADRPGHDHVGVGDETRTVRVEHVKNEGRSELRLTEARSPETRSRVVRRHPQEDQVGGGRPVSPRPVHQPGPPGSCARYHRA